MALSEEQDRSIAQMREQMAALSNEDFVSSINVRGTASTVLMLIGMLPDAARKQIVLALKTEYPDDFAQVTPAEPAAK